MTWATPRVQGIRSTCCAKVDAVAGELAAAPHAPQQGDEMDRARRAIRQAAREFVDAAGTDASRYLTDQRSILELVSELECG